MKEGTLKQNYVIPKGALILGQEQDSYMGGFSESQSFQGNLTSCNIWDRVLTADEIKDMSHSYHTPEGNAVSWSDLKHKTHGKIQADCTPICH